ncbi:MAG: glycosyltransferase family 4 protein [Actinobacteria bacterium]|nr:glycosyltransferase family 4 protein [Actinomycetota bacterium]
MTRSALETPWVIDPAGHDRPDALHVCAILPTLNPYGGVVSVVNLCEELLEMGHRYTLASLSQNAVDRVFPRSEPIHVPNWDLLPEVLPTNVDVVLATSWETVGPAVRLTERTGGRARAVYFVQDMEADFYDDQHTVEAVHATYERIPTLVVKTAHLEQRLAERGFVAHRIPPGMNLDIFYPRDVERRSGVLAMARPGVPNDHRGFEIVREVFRRLTERRPDLELVLFGSDDLPPDVETIAENAGRLQPSELPALYSTASVFLDASRHHGFGRTGAEAMACGTPCVLSDSGGIREYAEHEHNALIVPVADVNATVAAIERLLDDPDLAQRLAQAGRRTVQAFGERQAALAMLEVFGATGARTSDRDPHLRSDEDGGGTLDPSDRTT